MFNLKKDTKNYRLHMTSQELNKTQLYSKSNVFRQEQKPLGIWFACGTEWIEDGVSKRDWISPGITTSDMYLYHFEMDMSNILQIETPTQFEDFQRRYGMYNNTSRT